MKSMYRENSKWATLKAVENQELHRIPSGVFFLDKGSTTTLLVMWMATLMQPELFSDIDMVEEIYDKIISEKEKEGIAVNKNITPRQIFTYIAAKGKCKLAGTNQRWVQTGSYAYGTPCIKNIGEIMGDENFKILLERLQEKIFVRNLIFNNISYIKLV